MGCPSLESRPQERGSPCKRGRVEEIDRPSSRRARVRGADLVLEGGIPDSGIPCPVMVVLLTTST